MRRDGLNIYKVESYDGQPLIGTFYQEELQSVEVEKDRLWIIEKIIRRRKNNGKKQVLVRWLNWPSKYDSWIPASDVEDY